MASNGIAQIEYGKKKLFPASRKSGSDLHPDSFVIKLYLAKKKRRWIFVLVNIGYDRAVDCGIQISFKIALNVMSSACEKLAKMSLSAVLKSHY